MILKRKKEKKTNLLGDFTGKTARQLYRLFSPLAQQEYTRFGWYGKPILPFLVHPLATYIYLSTEVGS